MRNLFTLLPLIFLFFCFLVIPENISFAQGIRFNEPLTMQGLDKNTNYSAVSRALGGTTIGINNDASIMFSNPAELQNLNSFQITLGNSYWMLDQSQVQQYRSEEHTSELQSLRHLVCRLLLEKKKI